jgi:hypothetical protein
MTSENPIELPVKPRSALLQFFNGHASGPSRVEHDDLRSDSSSLLQECRPVGLGEDSVDVRGEDTPDGMVT